MPKCRACPAQIWWAKTEKGKPMPVNAHPSDEGNLIIVSRPPQSASVIVHVLHADEDPPPEVQRYTPHFASCPGRKKRKK